MRAGISIAVILLTTVPVGAQVTAHSTDTPIVVPDGGAGQAESTIEFPVDGTVEDLELEIAVTFLNPDQSGVFLELLGPSEQPPHSGFLFLSSPHGGNLYLRVNNHAAESCNDVCAPNGCGSPGNPVTCHAFDDLSPLFGESAQDQWLLSVGNGPPTAGTVFESWSLTLWGTGGLNTTIFEDGFETGDVGNWFTSAH